MTRELWTYGRMLAQVVRDCYRVRDASRRAFVIDPRAKELEAQLLQQMAADVAKECGTLSIESVAEVLELAMRLRMKTHGSAMRLDAGGYIANTEAVDASSVDPAV